MRAMILRSSRWAALSLSCKICKNFTHAVLLTSVYEIHFMQSSYRGLETHVSKAIQNPLLNVWIPNWCFGNPISFWERQNFLNWNKNNFLLLNFTFWTMPKNIFNEIGFYKTSIGNSKHLDKIFLHYLDTSIHFSVEPGNDFFNLVLLNIRNARFTARY